ncbi:MAG: hypothetical protein WEB85_01650 [Dongiaceae bacterium]
MTLPRTSAAAAPEIGTRSGRVMTVLGPIPVESMGVTLMHEHLLIDASAWFHCLNCAGRAPLATQPLDVGILGELRMDPFANLDNCRLEDVDAAVEEVGQFRELGGATVVDPTNVGIGRDPVALQTISRRAGLNVVMGAGFYLEGAQPERVRRMSADDIAEEIVRDVTEGVAGSGVRAGVIGEIGVGAEFTAAEQKSLRGAARAAALTGVPLSVHLPGWKRLADRVLDIVAEEGADLAHTVLCHMNPSLDDFAYQTRLAERGAFLEYDMIGMDYYYADQDAQSPCDEANAAALKRLIDAGYLNSLLLSHDVFLKMMLTRHGGFGYGYILRHFAPRLKRHGVGEAQLRALLVDNPRRVFSAPAGAGAAAASEGDVKP